MPTFPTEQPKKKGKKRKLSQPDGKSNSTSSIKKKTKNGMQNEENGRKNNSKNNSSSNSSSSGGNCNKTNGTEKKKLRTVFDRVAKRRQQEIALLEPALVRCLLMEIRELTGKELPSLGATKPSSSSSSSSSLLPVNEKQAAHEVRTLVCSEYKTISDENAPPDKRRKSWQIVNEIFHLIDTLTGQALDDDDDDDDDDEYNSETKEHGIHKTKPLASAAATTESSSPKMGKGKESGKEPETAAKPSNDSGKATASARVNAQSSATTKSSAAAAAATSSSQQKSTNTTTTSAVNGATKSSARPQKRAPVRTVASLSLSSAMTTATALDSDKPTKKVVNTSRQPSTHPSMLRPPVPAGTAPPPYQKESSTAQQHKNQKLQKQNEQQRKGGAHLAMRSHVNKDTPNPSPLTNSTNTQSRGAIAGATPETIVATNATAAPVQSSTVQSTAVTSSSSSSSSSNSPTSLSNSDKNSKTGRRPDPIPPNTSKRDTSIPEITEKPIDKLFPHKIILPADDSKTKPTTYSCFVQDRPRVELTFNHFEPTKDMTATFKRRLEKWDPLWIAEEHFCLGVTSPVTGQKYDGKKKPLFYPQTAARFVIKDLVKVAGPFLRQVQYDQQPVDNERRVLIRMLPLYLSKQKGGGKYRSDVHLWPKGTYLQIGLPNLNGIGMPQILHQRKQQSHDCTKWLGICRHLDITSMVHQTYSSTVSSLKQTSGDSTVELGCYESELYMFSLALCRYRSPQTLCKTLLHPRSSLLRRVGLDEMQMRVKKIMESNQVILDGDSDEEDKNNASAPKELKSIRFSIRDPIQRVALQNPVRGQKCLHISCFDLGGFLDMNKSPSGQRWKCGHCEIFLSHEDLELCALTEKASRQFGAQMGTLQNMVEFKEDGSLSLCNPVRSHQERARAKKLASANANPSQQKTSQSRGGDQEIVELLDTDSD